MPAIPTLIIASSLVLIFAWIVWRHFRFRHWPSLIFSFAALTLYVLLLRGLFGFPAFSEEDSKGSEGNTYLAQVFAMYVCMLAGMGAEYLFHYFDSGADKDRKFEIGTFVKPFLVSPLVFMPLATSLQNANLDLS